MMSMICLLAAVTTKTLLTYDRTFLIDCSCQVDVTMLLPNWAELCSQFKDVCLSPQVLAPLLYYHSK